MPVTVERGGYGPEERRMLFRATVQLVGCMNMKSACSVLEAAGESGRASDSDSGGSRAD